MIIQEHSDGTKEIKIGDTFTYPQKGYVATILSFSKRGYPVYSCAHWPRDEIRECNPLERVSSCWFDGWRHERKPNTYKQIFMDSLMEN